MQPIRFSFLISAGWALAACTEGIDTISPGASLGPSGPGAGGTSTVTSGSAGTTSSGSSGASSGTGGGNGTAGDNVIGTGGDVTTGTGGAGGGVGAAGSGGQSAVEAGSDAKADAPAVSTGLAAYWKLDEASGASAADSSGHNHTAAVAAATWVTGKVGPHAASFNGTAAYAEATGPVVDTSKPYTVAAWVQLSAVTGFRTAVSIDGAQVSAFFLQLRGDNGVRFGFSALAADAPGAATFAVGKATPLPNTWYHIAGVFDGASLKLYMNGALEASTPYTSAWAGTGSTAIGRGFYSGGRADFWPGLIDEVKLFGNALSDAEIAALATP